MYVYIKGCQCVHMYLIFCYHVLQSWKETLLASEQTFIENNKYGYEPPRAEYNPQAGDAMDVLPGTFKKLNVD